MSNLPFIEARFFSETEGRFELETRFKKHLRKLRCRRIPPNLLTPPDEVDAPGEISDANLMGSPYSHDDEIRACSAILDHFADSKAVNFLACTFATLKIPGGTSWADA